MRVTAEMTRHGRWWNAEIRDVPGLSARGRTLIDTFRMTCDAMVSATGENPSMVQLVVSYPEALAAIDAQLPSQRSTSATWMLPSDSGAPRDDS